MYIDEYKTLQFPFQGQEGIAPRMFKSLVGRGHPEFSTNKQQDAQEYLLHLVNIIEVSSQISCRQRTSRVLYQQTTGCTGIPSSSCQHYRDEKLYEL